MNRDEGILFIMVIYEEYIVWFVICIICLEDGVFVLDEVNIFKKLVVMMFEDGVGF